MNTEDTNIATPAPAAVAPKAKWQPKNATLEEAKKLTAEGKFPYYHPCSKTGKPCSTPTKAIWDKRVAQFGSIEKVYEQYICREERKRLGLTKSAQKPAAMASTEVAHPVTETPAEAPAEVPAEVPAETAPENTTKVFTAPAKRKGKK